ncbi:hypothetical protein AQI88_00200 [Streptomyces cellostaticus]|uniref:CN hydrolase domain-containing protein n=1 Tax=Streptomyces cellostaticus TaxID=67285 RepID=A0A101NTG9_9ACTN|nr:hypothetical protein [Streptomyces cellostaticus]KUM99030.1 hypothetical protein AQI88_00200 [Streptomyces cellostaticus]GHI03504.1 hypothetical protein Scel_18250 [Streptomyces cellostaticus]
MGLHRRPVAGGYRERSGGSLYMGQALISAEGRLLFARHKLKPTLAAWPSFSVYRKAAYVLGPEVDTAARSSSSPRAR